MPMNNSHIQSTIAIMTIKPPTNLHISKSGMLLQPHNSSHHLEIQQRYKWEYNTIMEYLTKHRIFFSSKYFRIKRADSSLSMSKYGSES